MKDRKTAFRTLLYVLLIALCVWGLYRAMEAGSTLRIIGGTAGIIFLILDYCFDIRRFLTLRSPEYKRRHR